MRGHREIDLFPVTPSNTRKLTVLSLSPLDEDHLSVHAIIGHSAWVHLPCYELSSAAALLQKYDISVVLCAEHLGHGNWADAVNNIGTLQDPPSLIVVSRAADTRLWAEALNLGAWDVLAKPLDRAEVIRSVKSGWQHRRDQAYRRTTAMKAMKAAG
jgi:DNA-binding NtrC family response regulator